MCNFVSEKFRNFINITTMAENQTPTPTKSRREQFGERLKKKYPDREFADDEALFGQIDDDYADYDNKLEQYKGREKELSDMFTSDPRSAHFLMNWRKGEHPMTAFIRQFGKDGLEEIVNNDDKMEEFAKANEEYLTRVAKEKEIEDQYQVNLAESLKTLEQFQQERQLGDEVIDAAMDLVMKIANEAIVGKFTAETIDMALNAVNHDADVQNARTEGQVAGRNAKIDEKLRKPTKGDGQPNLAGSNNAPTRKSSGRSMFDLADEAR